MRAHVSDSDTSMDFLDELNTIKAVLGNLPSKADFQDLIDKSLINAIAKISRMVKEEVYGGDLRRWWGK